MIVSVTSMCVNFASPWVGLPSVIVECAGTCKNYLFVGHIYFEEVDISIYQKSNVIFTSTKMILFQADK